MSEFGDIVQGKCDAFADRVVKLAARVRLRVAGYDARRAME